LISNPEQIHLVADIKLSPKNNLLPIDTPDFEISPILSTIINYLRYFFIHHNYRRKGGQKCQDPILKTCCLTSQKESRTFRRLRS
jgi:hypothetical protein